jgi:hypothetical protein
MSVELLQLAHHFTPHVTILHYSKEPFGVAVPLLDSLSSPPGNNGSLWRVTSNGSDNGSLPNSSPPQPRQQQQQQQRQQLHQQQQRENIAAAAAATAAAMGAMKSNSSTTGSNTGLTGVNSTGFISRARLAAGRTDEQCKQLSLYCGASRTANLLRRGSDLNLNSGANLNSKASSKDAALIGYKRSSSTASAVVAHSDLSDEQQQQLYLNTAVPFSAVVLGAEGSGCSRTVRVLIEAHVNTSSNLHTASSSSTAAAAAAVPDVSSIKGKASVLALHYKGQGGGTGMSPYAEMASHSMTKIQVNKRLIQSCLTNLHWYEYTLVPAASLRCQTSTMQALSLLLAC